MSAQQPPKPVGPADIDHPRTALARLMFSAAAQELADKATVLVPTVSDESASAVYEWVEIAACTVRQAQEVLTRAVIWATERGLRSPDLGRALGGEDAEEDQALVEQYRPALDEWVKLLNDPYELVHGIGALVWQRQLPADVEQNASYLDEWCVTHAAGSTRDLAAGDGLADRMVSGRLPTHTELTELNREMRVSADLFDKGVPMTDPQYVALRERREALNARMDARLKAGKDKR